MFFPYFWSTCAKNAAIVPSDLSRTSSTFSDGSLTPPPPNTDHAALLAFLQQRGLAAKPQHQYATEMRQLKQALRLLTDADTELSMALNAFNRQFTQVRLTMPSVQEPATPVCKAFTAIDQAFMEDVRQALQQPNLSCLQHNFYTAVHYVYLKMNQCRQQGGLIYHQPRHAAEMLQDTAIILSTYFDAWPSLHLLALLCALSHDSHFLKQRFADEHASAKTLMRFLMPLLVTLEPTHQSLITTLIYVWIVGGTTPVFLEHNSQGQRQPNVTSLLNLTQAFLRQTHELQVESEHIALLFDIGEVLTKMDMQRTAIPLLHQPEPSRQEAAWQSLAPFFESVAEDQLFAARLRLSQGLRVLSEENNSPDSALYAFTTAVARFQSGHEDKPTLWDEKLIQLLAQKIGHGPGSEIAFALRMSNSGHTTLADLRLTHTWQQHAQVLEKLCDYLLSDKTVAEKSILLEALIRITPEQQGAHFNLTQLKSLCDRVEMALTQPYLPQLNPIR